MLPNCVTVGVKSDGIRYEVFMIANAAKFSQRGMDQSYFIDLLAKPLILGMGVE
jgi:hypothetical protein